VVEDVFHLDVVLVEAAADRLVLERLQFPAEILLYQLVQADLLIHKEELQLLMGFQQQEELGAEDSILPMEEVVSAHRVVEVVKLMVAPIAVVLVLMAAITEVQPIFLALIIMLLEVVVLVHQQVMPLLLCHLEEERESVTHCRQVQGNSMEEAVVVAVPEDLAQEEAREVLEEEELEVHLLPPLLLAPQVPQIREAEAAEEEIMQAQET